jgi:hypothetical protein
MMVGIFSRSMHMDVNVTDAIMRVTVQMNFPTLQWLERCPQTKKNQHQGHP